MAHSKLKKIRSLEDLTILGAFILQDLYAKHHAEMGVGMKIHVRDYLRRANQVKANAINRESNELCATQGDTK